MAPSELTLRHEPGAPGCHQEDTPVLWFEEDKGVRVRPSFELRWPEPRKPRF